MNNKLITKYILTIKVLFFILISKALANPFATVESNVQQVESGIFGVVNALVITWFIVGVFWWLFTKRGFLVLVLLPLIGWSIINGREMLFTFAKTFIGS